jgi:hypothetical protein
MSNNITIFVLGPKSTHQCIPLYNYYMLVKLLKELFWGRKVATLLPQNKENIDCFCFCLFGGLFVWGIFSLSFFFVPFLPFLQSLYISYNTHKPELASERTAHPPDLSAESGCCQTGPRALWPGLLDQAISPTPQVKYYWVGSERLRDWQTDHQVSSVLTFHNRYWGYVGSPHSPPHLGKPLGLDICHLSVHKLGSLE